MEKRTTITDVTNKYMEVAADAGDFKLVLSYQWVLAASEQRESLDVIDEFIKMKMRRHYNAIKPI